MSFDDKRNHLKRLSLAALRNLPKSMAVLGGIGLSQGASKSFFEYVCCRRRTCRLQLLGLLLLALFAVTYAGPDHYKTLGVDKSASQRDIKKAFHKLSLK